MNELLSSGLWTRIRKLGKKAKKKSAAVAYVTDDRYLKFGKGDLLVVSRQIVWLVILNGFRQRLEVLRRSHIQYA